MVEKMSKNTKEIISLYLRKDTINKIDQCANYVGLGRSAFMEWMLKFALPTIPEVTSKIKETFKKRAKEFWECDV